MELEGVSSVCRAVLDYVDIVLYGTMHCIALLWYAVLRSGVLFYIELFDVMLYCVLRCNILRCRIISSSVLCCAGYL